MPLCKLADLPRLLPPGARLMGLDFGTRTIGIAVSAAALRVAAPVPIVRRRKVSIDAAEIANRIHAGIERGDPYILTHPEARRFWRLKRLLPHGVYLALMRRQLAKVAARRRTAPAATASAEMPA